MGLALGRLKLHLRVEKLDTNGCNNLHRELISMYEISRVRVYILLLNGM